MGEWRERGSSKGVIQASQSMNGKHMDRNVPRAHRAAKCTLEHTR